MIGIDFCAFAQKILEMKACFFTFYFNINDQRSAATVKSCENRQAAGRDRTFFYFTTDQTMFVLCRQAALCCSFATIFLEGLIIGWNLIEANDFSR